MTPRVVGRDGSRILVDLGQRQRGVALGATVEDGIVSPALPVDAFIEAGLFDEAVADEAAVLAKVGEPKPGLPLEDEEVDALEDKAEAHQPKPDLLPPPVNGGRVVSAADALVREPVKADDDADDLERQPDTGQR